jgi:hypothetical protein
VTKLIAHEKNKLKVVATNLITHVLFKKCDRLLSGFFVSNYWKQDHPEEQFSSRARAKSTKVSS